MQKSYDYIILGAGCAGLSLAYRMAINDFFRNKTILIIERDQKNKNDRTWCHWSKSKGIFDEVVCKSWKKVTLHNEEKNLKKDIQPYSYKMIRGIDFYQFVLPKLEASPNIDIIYSEVEEIIESETGIDIVLESGSYRAGHVFKSFTDIPKDHNDHFVIQHFKGYFIKSDRDFFKEDEIRFMDFRTDQKGETRFFYVLPTNKREALVELAIFSNQVLMQEDYDAIIQEYMSKHLKELRFEVLEKEFGTIPMTTYDFTIVDTSRITHIGTAGGCVKPSSGFAFKRIQDHSDAIVEYIQNDKNPKEAQAIFKPRFKRYDKTFMNVLLTGKESGAEVFLQLFEKLDATLVLKFLDEETHFFEELKLFTAPPTLSFLKAFMEELSE